MKKSFANKKLYVVATPIGNIADLSERAKQTLKIVDAVLAEDTRVSSKLLFMLGIKKPMFSCHKFNEMGVSDELKNLFERFDSLALVSDAGTPGVSDPGAIIVARARELGVSIEALPGASAVVTALSLAGINKTEFAFLGFFPRTAGDKTKFIKKIESATKTVSTFIIYESPQRIIETVKMLGAELNKKINKLCVFNDLTKQFERHYIGSAKVVANELEQNPNVNKGEYVIVLDLNEHLDEAELDNGAPSLEAIIIDYIAKNNCTAKDAISALTKQGFKKNELYKASLNLKNLIK